MRNSEFIPSKVQIERPDCDKCGVQMWLARIQPDKPDHYKRTFECPVCENVTCEVINTIRAKVIRTFRLERASQRVISDF